ncbi:MAG: hypothetical protein JWP01_3366 [Myxococcales bacterium]|nr:hypothetical protein [Myxococcales bacterium]
MAPDRNKKTPKTTAPGEAGPSERIGRHCLPNWRIQHREDPSTSKTDERTRQPQRIHRTIASMLRQIVSTRRPSLPSSAGGSAVTLTTTCMPKRITRELAVAQFREIFAQLDALRDLLANPDSFLVVTTTLTKQIDRGHLIIPAIPSEYDFLNLWRYEDRGILPEDGGAPLFAVVRKHAHYHRASKRVLDLLDDEAFWLIHSLPSVTAHVSPSALSPRLTNGELPKLSTFPAPKPPLTQDAEASALKGQKVLLLAATHAERNAILSRLQPAEGQTHVLRVFEGAQTYYWA